MKSFTLGKIPRVYFGTDSLQKAMIQEQKQMGKTVLIAYGGNSIKTNHIFDTVKRLLEENGKTVLEFGGIMSNPTYQKVQDGAKFVRENNVDFIFAVGGGSVIDCCKMISAQAKTEEDIWKMEFEKVKFPSSYILMA